MLKKTCAKDIVKLLKEKFPEQKESLLKEIYSEVACIFKETIENRNTLFIKGLGTFKPVTTKQRIGRNLITGEKVTIPEKNKVKFTLTRSVKEKINEKKAEPKKTKDTKKTKNNPYKKGK